MRTAFGIFFSKLIVNVLPFTFTLLLESVGGGGGPYTVVMPLIVPTVLVAVHV